MNMEFFTSNRPEFPRSVSTFMLAFSESKPSIAADTLKELSLIDTSAFEDLELPIRITEETPFNLNLQIQQHCVKAIDSTPSFRYIIVYDKDTQRPIFFLDYGMSVKLDNGDTFSFNEG